MTDAAFGFNSVSFSMQDNRAAYLQELENRTRSTSGGGVLKGKRRPQKNKNYLKKKLQDLEKV